MSQNLAKRKKKPIFEQPAYHYTSGLKVSAILASGLLSPKTNSMYDSTLTERPVLLFSTNEQWEAKADKTADKSGIVGTAEQGRGIYRFIYPVRKLHSWHNGTLQRKAKISSTTAKDLELVASKDGAMPSQWFGALTDISVLKMGLEVLRNDGVWLPYDQFDKDTMQPFFGTVKKP